MDFVPTMRAAGEENFEESMPQGQEGMSLAFALALSSTTASLERAAPQAKPKSIGTRRARSRRCLGADGDGGGRVGFSRAAGERKTEGTERHALRIRSSAGGGGEGPSGLAGARRRREKIFRKDRGETKGYVQRVCKGDVDDYEELHCSPFGTPQANEKQIPGRERPSKPMSALPQRRGRRRRL